MYFVDEFEIMKSQHFTPLSFPVRAFVALASVYLNIATAFQLGDQV